MTTKTKTPWRATPWREVRTPIGTDAKTGETIYEVREERRLPGGYTETRRAVKRTERDPFDLDDDKPLGVLMGEFGEALARLDQSLKETRPGIDWDDDETRDHYRAKWEQDR